jgi:mRNA interferase MazF
MVMRGDIWLVALDPTVGSEIRKSRPCMVVSPAEMHGHLRTVLVAPMTTKSQGAPYRIPIMHDGKKGLVLLDELRAVDKTRLLKRFGAANQRTLLDTLATLREVFAD